MNRVIITFLISFALVSCLSPRYSINEKGFKSNRELWGLAISVLKVDSLNAKGIPVKYKIIRKYETEQKGDHRYDDNLKEYGYYFKPQKKILFSKKSKYYYWSDSEFKKYDSLPVIFSINTWYLLTQWQPASAGGGVYNLFVLVNEKGQFEKHFQVESGSW